MSDIELVDAAARKTGENVREIARRGVTMTVFTQRAWSVAELPKPPCTHARRFSHSALEGQHQDPTADHQYPEPLTHRWSLMKKQDGKHGDQDDAELVDGGNFRGVANLQCPEVADPRCPGRQPRQDQKQQGLAGQRQRIRPFARRRHEAGQDHRDDSGAHQGRKVGIDTR